MRLANRLAVAISAALVVTLAIVLTNVLPVREILARREAVEQARTQLETLQRENARLGAEAEALQTPTEVERIARESLGYVRPGETAYRVVPPDGEEEATPSVAATPDPASPDQRTWLEKIWDYLTGADTAAGDGS